MNKLFPKLSKTSKNTKPQFVEKTVISSVEYHRNGVSGQGFYRVDFTFDNGNSVKNLIAVVDSEYYENPNDERFDLVKCFVVNPLEPSDCYRGDRFFADIKVAIDEHICIRDKQLTS